MHHGCAGLAPYHPGEFYRRELPCIAPLVKAALAARPISTVIVDGFVDLAEGRPGLGRHLHETFGRAFEVVGVAKSPFAGSSGSPVCRGTSTRPLWVTATGDSQIAAENVRTMAGEYRMPTILRVVDRLTREALP
jgi:deoxyribonuclease V